jgi:exopolysaccharide production protein ExoZ
MPRADRTTSMRSLERLAAQVYEVPGAASRLAPLEGLRAYAAFLIFLVHYCDAYATAVLRVDLNALQLSTVPDIATGATYYLFASHYGVDLFFFLSGFLICRILRRPTFGYASFALHRVARVYPAFLVSLGVWAYVRIGVQHWYPLEGRQLLGNLLFLNALPGLGVKPYNTVTWSLFFEFVFYLTFPLVLAFGGRRRRMSPQAIGVFAVLFMAAALQFGPFFIRFLMFFGGALLAVLPEAPMTRFARCIPDRAALALYVASTALFAELLGYTYFIPVFLVATFVLVVRIVHGDGWLRRMFSWMPLRYLGNVSYSFYLVHGLGVELVMNRQPSLFAGLHGAVYVALTFVTALLTSVVFATVLFLVAEKPYFLWRRRAETADRTLLEPRLAPAAR